MKSDDLRQALELPEIKALIEALEQSQKMLKRFSAMLDAFDDPLHDWGAVIETQKQIRAVLDAFGDHHETQL